MKWRSSAWSLDATLFHVDVADEIGVASNAGGRQSFRNVGRTRREGAELAATWRVLPSVRAQLALTLLNARYRDSFLVCAAIPCTTPNVPVAAGNRIAGTQRLAAFGEVAWRAWPGGELGLEWRHAAALIANDSNSEAAPSYALVGLRATQRWNLGDGFGLEALLRLDNAANRAHAASVIVNDANGRFYEPGAPRNVLLSLRVSRVF